LYVGRDLLTTPILAVIGPNQVVTGQPRELVNHTRRGGVAVTIRVDLGAIGGHENRPSAIMYGG
jgi:hypothetical protein